MIETGSEYQLLQNFEAIPIVPSGSNGIETDKEAIADVTVNIEGASAKDVLAKNSAVNKFIDGSKFDTFVDAIVNLIIVIPVK